MRSRARRHALAIFAILGLGSACASIPSSKPADSIPTTRETAARKLGRNLIATESADGLSIALIEQGHVRYLNFGLISRTGDRSPDQNTVYEIGSITKVFTSLLLARAVVERRIDLQDDIRKHLPGDFPNLEAEGSPIRLVHLAETTSGLPDNLPDLAPFIAQAGVDRAPFLIASGWKAYSSSDFLRDLRGASLLNRPGTTSRHSNVAATLLGMVVAKTYGEPYAAVVARYIERPLGMTVGLVPSAATVHAQGYNSNGLPMPSIDGDYIRSAGGLRYSSADMARFARAQLRAGDAAIALSQRPTRTDGQSGLGFNWRMAKSEEGRRILRASGGTFGSSSYLEVRPDDGYAIVLLTNRSGIEDALYRFADHVWQSGRCARACPPSPNAVPPAKLRQSN